MNEILYMHIIRIIFLASFWLFLVFRFIKEESEVRKIKKFKIATLTEDEVKAFKKEIAENKKAD